MGKYVRAKLKGRRSVHDALTEAQEDHYIDCPDADFMIRAAAFVLDGIFLFLILSSVNRLFFATAASFSWLGEATANTSSEYSVPFASLLLASDATLVYLYTLWTLQRFGASPAKLLLNLQVVDVRSGGKLGLTQAVLRELIGKLVGGLLLGLGFWLALYRKDSRALHDLLASSAVKKIDEDGS